jgi:hypothetical protein
MTSWLLLAALAGAAPALSAGDNPEASKAPMAKKIVKTTDIHGEKLADDYFWLRDRQNPEVKAYLEAENAFADSVMKPTVAFQEALYKEMLGRIKETDLSVPYREGAYLYYSRTEQGKQYPIYCRKKGNLEAPEQVMLPRVHAPRPGPFDSQGLRGNRREGLVSRLGRGQQDSLLHGGRRRQAALPALPAHARSGSEIGRSRLRGEGRDVPRGCRPVEKPQGRLPNCGLAHGRRMALHPI